MFNFWRGETHRHISREMILVRTFFLNLLLFIYVHIKNLLLPDI